MTERSQEQPMDDFGRVTGSREPSPDGLGPSGFDPARKCDVCAQPLSRHDTGAGIPICPGIYAPGYRTKLRDEIYRLRETLIDWRNCWLCPATDFDAQIERLLAATDAALGPQDIAQ